MIDVAITSDNNIRNKEDQKLEKYQGLRGTKEDEDEGNSDLRVTQGSDPKL